MGLRTKLSIWQQNVNKSPTCQHNLISSGKLTDLNIDIIALQEPAINAFANTIATKDWTPIYPTTHNASPDKTRSVTLLRADISTDTWTQLDFPSGDVTVIQIADDWGKLTIFNIYNEGKSNNTIKLLTKYHKDNCTTREDGTTNSTHTIWLGDFNRHHPHWDDPNDVRLFTDEAIKATEVLIEAVAEAGLELALPCQTPTHLHNITKRWSRLDQVFISDHSDNLLISCDTLADHMGINMDHLPILTELNLAANSTTTDPTPNFRNVDWEEFRETLAEYLSALQPAVKITEQRHLDRSCASLMEAIQYTIHDRVPKTTITTKSKRWWTKELTQLRWQSEKLGRQSYKLRGSPDHAIHTEHKEAVKRYDKTLQYTKRQHWHDWLEKAEEPDIWTASKMVSAPVLDRGKARILTLKHKVGDQETAARTNGEKSRALAKCFFLTKPQLSEAQDSYIYPQEYEGHIAVTAEQVRSQLHKLKPYKALGPDSIPNIVLSKCADLLTDRLLPIYEAMFESGLMYKPWKTFTTVVLRKPGKPRYDVPKAYRPIALINTMWKVLTAIIAEHLTYITEKNQLLPANHFSGRPGRMTTDTMHLLNSTIKASWRAGKVTSVLFLDIEGAFPNAVPEKLTHNMRKRQVPTKITNFIHNMSPPRWKSRV